MGSRKSLTKLGNTKYLTYNCNRNMKLITESKISPRHLANQRSAKQRTLFLINHLKEMSIYKSNLVCELLDLKDKNLIGETYYNNEIKLQRALYKYYKGYQLKLTNYYNTLEYVEIKTTLK